MTGEHTSERGGEISRRRCAIARTFRIPLKREILYDNRQITARALREQFVAENRSLRTGKTADFHGITGTLRDRSRLARHGRNGHRLSGARRAPNAAILQTLRESTAEMVNLLQKNNRR